jgi:hypothetical protein
MQDLKILQKTESLHEARWWEPMSDGRVHCFPREEAVISRDN